MAISFVGSASEADVNGTDITLDLTTITGLAQNDLVIIGYAIGSSDDGDYNLVINTPTDYNEVADLFADDTQDCQLGVFWKVQGATPDADVTVEGFGNMNNSVAVIAMAFRGVDTTTPMDVTPTTATGTNSANADPPSINHNNPSGVWTVIVGAAGHNQGDLRSFTFPTGYTTNAVSLSANDSDDILLGMGYRSSGVSDPEDPGVMTFTGGADQTIFSWCACTLALRPAAAGDQFTQQCDAVCANVATCVRKVFKANAATVAAVATNKRQTRITEAVVVSAVAGVRKHTTKGAFAAVTSNVAGLTRRTLKSAFAAVTSNVATATAINIYLVTCAAVTENVATVSKHVSKTLAVIAQTVPAIRRHIGKRIVAVVNASAVLATANVFLQTCSASVSAVADLATELIESVGGTFRKWLTRVISLRDD